MRQNAFAFTALSQTVYMLDNWRSISEQNKKLS